MKKNFKLILALVLSIMMVLGSVSALADKTSVHTITIQNTDQYVSHTYEAYQVFKGNLDNATKKLSDIGWGSGVNAAGLITALTGANAPASLAAIKTALGTVDTTNATAVAAAAAKVAEELGKLTASDTANAIDDFASLVAANVTTTKASFTENNKEYTASVTGDGYYFIKDTTADASLDGTNGSDSLSKYMLNVIADVTIQAKDTHLAPNKQVLITEGKASAAEYERVKENTAAVGDTVTFEVTIPVPNTKKYVDHFIFDMVDTLPAGMTFTGISSIKVGNFEFSDYTKNDGATAIAANTYDGTAGYYTLKVNGTVPTATKGKYEFEATDYDAVTATGGQAIKVVFNEFKKVAEKNNLIGSSLVVTYTAVVNDDAYFTPTGNENEVKFDFSNDPNHDYNGDEPGPDDPMGETPKDKTKTKLINLEIQKTGDGGQTAALEGAEFEISSNDYNVTLVTGEKFEESTDAVPYVAKTGETIQTGTYYQLKAGGFTTTAPTDSTKSMYVDEGAKTYVKVTFENCDVTPGTTKKVTVITGADGKIVLKGLKPGTYTIKETKAPAGYNLDPTEHVIKVDWTYDATAKTGSFALDSTTSDSSATFVDTTAKAGITIDNKSGTQLPSTGGIGTTIFYVAGSILVLAAAILLITKRRMGAND